jgi:hypothetical protein
LYLIGALLVYIDPSQFAGTAASAWTWSWPGFCLTASWLVANVFPVIATLVDVHLISAFTRLYDAVMTRAFMQSTALNVAYAVVFLAGAMCKGIPPPHTALRASA